MHRLLPIGLAAFLLVLAPCSLSFAEESPTTIATLKDQKNKTEKSDKTPAGIPAPYATIIKELGLEGEQREAFIAGVRQRQQDIAAWKKENEPQQKLLQQKIADAKLNGNIVEENKARAELKALNDELARIEEEHQAQLLGTLTPEQRGKWIAYNAYTGLMRTYAKVDLTPDQKAQVKTIVYQNAGAFAALPEGDRKAREALRQQIMQQVHDQVLTDPQKAQLEPKIKPKSEKSKD